MFWAELCEFPSDSYVEVLTPNGMVFEDEVSGR